MGAPSVAIAWQNGIRFTLLEVAQQSIPSDWMNQEAHAFYAWECQKLHWLQQNDSGAVQFIRDRYGLQWLNRIEPYHFEKYSAEDILKLKVGDRIEVCNALWEWVQDNSPCLPEWYSCIVIKVDEISNGEDSCTNCIIRFNNGSEFEIQGMYQWNRFNWRRLQS